MSLFVDTISKVSIFEIDDWIINFKSWKSSSKIASMDGFPPWNLNMKFHKIIYSQPENFVKSNILLKGFVNLYLSYEPYLSDNIWYKPKKKCKWFLYYLSCGNFYVTHYMMIKKNHSHVLIVTTFFMNCVTYCNYTCGWFF